jgi:hypothetical protein
MSDASQDEGPIEEVGGEDDDLTDEDVASIMAVFERMPKERQTRILIRTLSQMSAEKQAEVLAEALRIRGLSDAEIDHLTRGE